MTGVSSTFDRAVESVRDRLAFTAERQKLIAGNLANMETPGFVAKDLTFEAALRESAAGLRMAGGSAGGAGPAGEAPSFETVEAGPVDLDREMMKLARNSVEYQFMVAMLTKKLGMMKHVISEGGR